MVTRHGWWVAAHFGSPAGELALCETAVGLADRSDLGKLELRGEASRDRAARRPAQRRPGRPRRRAAGRGRLVVRGLAGARARAVRRRRDRARPLRRGRGRALDAGRDGHRRHAALRGARAARPPHRRRARRAQRLRAAAGRRRVARLRRPAARRHPGDAPARRAGQRRHASPRRRAPRRCGPRSSAPAERRASAASAPTRCPICPRSRAHERGTAARRARRSRPVKVHAPSERNRKLAAFLAAATATPS